MAQPDPYVRDYDFQGYQTGHPSTPLPGDKVNDEFDAIANAVDQIRMRIADLQRDDLEVHNEVIGFDQLKDELRHGFTTPTVWTAGTAYALGSQVYLGRKVYAALKAHTASSLFNIDNNAGKWYLLADFTAVTAVDESAAQAADSAAASAVAAAASATTALTKASAASTSETNAATSAAAAAASAASIAAGNFLDKATFDPNSVGGNVFDMANMAEATDAKIMTAAERTKLGIAVTSTATDASTFGFVAGKDATPADKSMVVPTVERVDSETLYKAADRTALKALSGTAHATVYLREAGRDGIFKWDSSDLSAKVTIDTAEGIYVAPTSDATGASGAWVRVTASLNEFMFGATGDGTTDDAAAVQAMFALAPVVGLPIVSAAGTFVCSGITVSSDTHLRANGLTIYKQTSDTDTKMLNIGGNTNISIKDLELDGNSKATLPIAGGAGNKSIEVSGCIVHDTTATSGALILIGISTDVSAQTDIRIIGNYCYNSTTGGIAAYGNQVVIDGNNVRNTTGAGISYVTDGITITGNTVDGVTGTVGLADCITGYDEGNTDFVISSNVCKNGNNNGIHVGGNRGVISNNSIYNPSQRGITAWSAPNAAPTAGSNIAITGNTIESPGNDGIASWNVAGLTVTGNVIDTPVGGGIVLTGITNFSVAGNSVKDATSHGINADADCSVGAISGNVVNGSGGYGINWNGTKITVSGNTLTGCTSGPLRDSYTGTDGDNFCTGNNCFDNTQALPLSANTADVLKGNRTDAADTIGAGATLTLRADGEVFTLANTGTITAIAGSFKNRVVTLRASGLWTMTDGTALKLAGDFTPTIGSTITLMCDGAGNWYETSRSVN